MGALLVCAGAGLAGPPAAAAAPRYRVLVFTRTEGFRHASIPAGVRALRAIGRSRGFSVTATARPGAFTDASLRRFRVVVFLSTTGNVLDPPQEAALQRYVEGGGGFVGVHAAANTETRWPFFGRLIGARFRGHAPFQAATVGVADRRHPATRGLPRTMRRRDEWYAFTANPRPHVHVLLTVDERTYRPGRFRMGRDHPIAWSHAVGRGRAFYTALGHASAAYGTRVLRRHLGGAIVWAART
jgi:type 1 glutamine amidotransferase